MRFSLARDAADARIAAPGGSGDRVASCRIDAPGRRAEAVDQAFVFLRLSTR